jgi:Cytochrome c554 and c-prime
MRRKLLIAGIRIFFIIGTCLPIRAEVNEAAVMAKILGNASCSTSGCHGGAGPLHGTVAQFNQQDPHGRSFATLVSARSARMGEALGIADVTKSPSCTACHAPVANVPLAARADDLRVEDGVGCASCHESSDTWLRTHARTDITHAQKVAAGMRDLRSATARANACVACHEVIEARLVDVGRHPRLMFELDGQIAAEPPHWREVHGWDGAKAWFVGQAVAWREVAAAQAAGRAPGGTGSAERERALGWLVQRASAQVLSNTDGKTVDELVSAVEGGWVAEHGAVVLRALAGSAAEFRAGAGEVSRLEQAYRAERLVLGLDRLLKAWPERARAAAAGPVLDKLFVAAQSVPDFEPEAFAVKLEELAGLVGR